MTRKLFWTMLRLLGLLLILTAAVTAQPAIRAIQNNYSYTAPGLPNYGIAQGSIFVVFGTDLANSSTEVQNAPLRTTLAGVSGTVTVNGASRAIIFYYVTPTQIAGILPSSTPVGTGTMVINNNGRASAPAPITVVQSAFGTLTMNGSGAGAAAVFDVGFQFLGPNNSTHPGDVIQMFGTGAGPVTGDETVAQVQVNLVNVPILVEVGGKRAEVRYHGRTQFPGLDQINVVIPNDVTPGCAVSVAVTSGIYVSNFTTIPVAASGANCPVDGGDPGLTLTQAEINRWIAAGQYTIGSIGLTRSTSYAISDSFGGGAPTTTVTRSDVASAGFNRVSGPIEKLLNSNQTTPAPGSCIVTSGFTNPFPDLVYKGLDAGTPISISGPAGSRTITRSINSAGVIGYSGEVGNGTPGNYIDPGQYTISGPGGPDIGSFSGVVTVAPELAWTNRTDLATITRANGATVRWTGGEPTTLVTIQGQSFVLQGTSVTTVIFQCYARNTDGQFAIPASVLLSLPPSASQVIAPGVEFLQRGTLAIATVGKGTRIQASGLDYGTLGSQYGVAQSAAWR